MTAIRVRRLLYASAFVRAMAVSTAGVTLGGFLGKLDAKGLELGIVVSAGLAGSAATAILATFLGDRVGRQPFLIGTSLLGIAGTCAFAAASSPIALAAAAFVGMINGMGKDRGAALILEQGVLPGGAPATERTRAVARATGAPVLLARTPSLTGVAPHRATLLACAACGLVAIAIYRRLGRALEVDAAPAVALTPRIRAIVVRISSLFAVA